MHGLWGWTFIKSEVCNLKTNQSVKCKGPKNKKKSLSLPYSCFETCTYTCQHEFSGALHIFSCLFYDNVYFFIHSQPVHHLYIIVYDALVLLWVQALHFQTQHQSVLAILVKAESWGDSLTVTVHSLWISGELILLRNQVTNLVLLYWNSCGSIDLFYWINM